MDITVISLIVLQSPPNEKGASFGSFFRQPVWIKNECGSGTRCPRPTIVFVGRLSSRTAVSSSCIAPCRYSIDSRIAAASSFGQPANSGVLPGACFSISNLTANLIRNPPSFGVAAATLGRLISSEVKTRPDAPESDRGVLGQGSARACRSPCGVQSRSPDIASRGAP